MQWFQADIKNKFMTHTKFSITVLLLLYISIGLSQSLVPDFKKLESKGDIPADFAKYIGDPKQQQSTLNYLFKSGFILYGTELNEYLENIMDIILKDYPDVRSKMRIYVYKSSSVNAMAFDDYIIVVNTGLLAQVQNESELAFILSHEMVHIVNKHIEKQNEKQSKKERREHSTGDVLRDQFMTYHYRSREHEFEADKEGFEKYFKNSGYNIYSVDGVFDVLQYNYLPYDEIVFNKSFLENSTFSFPSDYFLLNLNPIRSREDYIDTLSTHPNIAKRRIAIQKLVSKSNEIDGKNFIQSEELFYRIRDIARFESINKSVTVHNYGIAFFNTYIMLLKYPESEALNRLLVASLYGISKHKSNDNFSDVVDDYKKSEGNIQQTNYFFYKITKEELTILTLKMAWKYAHKYPNEDYYMRIAEDVIQYLYAHNSYNKIKKNINVIDSLNISENLNQQSLENEESDYEQNNNDEDVKPANKNPKIHLSTQKSLDNISVSKKDILKSFMFRDLIRDTLFVQWAKKQEERYKLYQDIPEDDLFYDDLKNCTKILVWNPNCYIVSSSFKVKNEPQSIINTIQELKKSHNIEIELIETKDFISFNTEKYNHFCNIQSLYFDRNYAEGIPMLFYTSDNIEETFQYFGTPYISFVDALISPTGFSGNRVQIALLAPVIPFLLPITLAHFLAPNKNCWIEISIINTASANRLEKREQINGYSCKAYINSYVYTIFNDLKKGAGK